MAEYRPNILVEIYATTTIRRATEYYDDGTNEYLPGLIEFPDFTGEMPDLYYGFETPQSIQVRLSDTYPGLSTDILITTQAATQEFRGKIVIIKVSDSGAAGTFVYSGKVTNYTISNGSVTFDIDMRADAVFDTILPKAVITTDDWYTSALDIGKPVNICIGYCRDVPIYNVRNDRVNEIYEYLIGYGPIGAVWETTGQLGVKRDGVYVSTAEYTLLNNTVYSGYAVLRFVREQINYSGGYHTLTCDVQGMLLGYAATQRNFAKVMKLLLTNTVYGLSDTIDTDTWATAATDLAPTSYYCDMLIGEQKPARDYFNEMLMVARSRLRRGADSEWEIFVDKVTAVSAYFGENDGYYNNIEIESIGKTPADQTFKTLTVKYAFHENDLTTPNHEMKTTVMTDFGMDKVIECRCVNEHVTALKTLSYNKNRAIYADGRIKFGSGLEGRTVNEGAVVRIYSLYPSTYVDYMIQKKTHNLVDKYEFEATTYSDSIYADLTVTYPTDPVYDDTLSPGPGQEINPEQVWITKDVDFTAQNNYRYAIDTTSVATSYLTMTLPATPTANAAIQWKDLKLNFATKYLYIARNGNLIMGETEDLVCLNIGDNGVLRFDGGLVGWALL